VSAFILQAASYPLTVSVRAASWRVYGPCRSGTGRQAASEFQ